MNLFYSQSNHSLILSLSLDFIYQYHIDCFEFKDIFCCSTLYHFLLLTKYLFLIRKTNIYLYRVRSLLIKIHKKISYLISFSIHTEYLSEIKFFNITDQKWLLPYFMKLFYLKFLFIFLSLFIFIITN